MKKSIVVVESNDPQEGLSDFSCQVRHDSWLSLVYFT
jgi:hypothetical protein